MRRSRNLNLTNSSPYSYIILEYPDLNKLKFQENEAIQKFDVNEFREITILGSSQFVVRQYEYIPRENFPIAIKIIPLPKSDNEKQKNLLKLLREIKNLKKVIAHPNIIKLYGVCLHKNEAWICMELMDMTLEELYLQAYQYYDIFPEKELGCIAVKVIDALKYCKSKEIIHRDLKPQNILLNKTGDIKLCDFGESRVLESDFLIL